MVEVPYSAYCYDTTVWEFSPYKFSFTGSCEEQVEPGGGGGDNIITVSKEKIWCCLIEQF